MTSHRPEASHSHDTHREVPHGGHDQVPQGARHEATNGLTQAGAHHKELSKLPSNDAAKHATPHLELHDSSKKSHDAAKSQESAKPSPERQTADHMVHDLQDKSNNGHLSPETTKEIGDIGNKAYKQGGQEGLQKAGEKIGNEFAKSQDDNHVPGWQKRFEFGNNTGKWQDFSITQGDSKDTSGFAYGN